LSDRASSARPTRSTYGSHGSHLNRANGVTNEAPCAVAESKITSRWLNATVPFSGLRVASSDPLTGATLAGDRPADALDGPLPESASISA
jgi:hypothetical protein